MIKFGFKAFKAVQNFVPAVKNTAKGTEELSRTLCMQYGLRAGGNVSQRGNILIWSNNNEKVFYRLGSNNELDFLKCRKASIMDRNGHTFRKITNVTDKKLSTTIKSYDGHNLLGTDSWISSTALEKRHFGQNGLLGFDLPGKNSFMEIVETGNWSKLQWVDHQANTYIRRIESRSLGVACERGRIENGVLKSETRWSDNPNIGGKINREC